MAYLGYIVLEIKKEIIDKSRKTTLTRRYYNLSYLEQTIEIRNKNNRLISKKESSFIHWFFLWQFPEVKADHEKWGWSVLQFNR